ncbi:MAG: hypothetical protein DRJ37_05015 [Thermoprotei archaeon]|nr:MAG: hypothetical protein DRJ37_05015 [Thermoprotei archaeon]
MKARKSVILLVFLTVLLAVLVKAQPAGSNFLDTIISEVETVIVNGLRRMLMTVIKIARIAYLLMGIAGVLMWASGYAISRGKQLIVGAIIIAVLLEALSGSI